LEDLSARTRAQIAAAQARGSKPPPPHPRLSSS
jgi:DNA invertase Pin-like site-specific DNA recombinase